MRALMGTAQPPTHFVQVMVTAPEGVIDSVQRVSAMVVFPSVTVQPPPCAAWLQVFEILGIFVVVPSHVTVIRPDNIDSEIEEGTKAESMDTHV